MLILSPVLFLFATPFAADAMIRRTPSAEMTELVQSLPDETLLIADRDTAHALSWLSRRTDLEIVINAGEFSPGLDSDPTRSLIAEEALADLLAGRRALGGTLTVDRPVALMLARKRWENIADGVPPPDLQLRADRFVLSLYEAR